jgi:hypothetical protein
MRQASRSPLTARHQWLSPVILATQEAKIWRVMVRSQPGEIVLHPVSQKTLSQKKWAGEVTQGKGPEAKPQYWKKRSPLFFLGIYLERCQKSFYISGTILVIQWLPLHTSWLPIFLSPSCLL